MRQRTMGRLVTAIIAAGLIGGLALGNPSALADPEVPPPTARRRSIRPQRPRRRRIRSPPPPPADPLAPPPADPCRAAAAGGSAGAAASGRPVAPPPADPLAAAQPTAIPEGTPGRPEPDAVHRGAGVRAADVQPDQRLDGRRRPSRSSSTSRGRSPTGRWPSRRSTSRRSRRCPASSTGRATPRCAGGRRTSGRPTPSSTSTPSGTKSSFRTGEPLVATIDDKTHQMTVIRNGKVEKTFPVSMGKPTASTTPRTAPTTCWRSSPTS